MLTRFVTAGSVDDGKSTLIGRLLWDTRAVFEDQIAAVSAVSERRGQSQPDLSLLTDGLIAEREQGITIDVAYRYFNTARRKFIVADCPGHEQYTRNMVTGASNADVAVLLVDARKGLLPQTRRHAAVCGWLGLKRVILAVNKIDLVDWSEDRFRQIEKAFREWCAPLGLAEVFCVPVSALEGDGVVHRGAYLDWYQGPTLLELLERPLLGELDGIDDSALANAPLRFPVQWVIRGAADLDPDFRGLAGKIEAGTVRRGDQVVVLRDRVGERAHIAEIRVGEQRLEQASAGRSVTIRLDREIDVSRGDLLVAGDGFVGPAAVRAAGAAPLSGLSDQLTMQVCWFAQSALRTGDRLLVKIGTRTVRAEVDLIQARIDVETLKPFTDQPQGAALQANDLAQVSFALHEAVFIDMAPTGARLGIGSRCLLIDEATDITVGAGVLRA